MNGRIGEEDNCCALPIADSPIPRSFFSTGYRLLAILLLMVLLLPACSPAYVLRAGYEEAKILWSRRPIEEILRRQNLDAQTREKLQLVLRVRQFAEQELGFSVGQSYTSVAEVEKPPLVHVVSAAPRTRLEPYTWWFPIVGSVAYKGYFNELSAKEEAQALEADGYDTALAKAIAFSTLGWFADPLLPHLLKYDQEILANTIIHELFHSTFYLPGQTAFNESLANFAGHRGAIAFFAHEPGADADATQRATTNWESELALAGFFSESAEKLNTLYTSSRPEEEKLQQREVLFQQLQEAFKQLPMPVRRNTDFSSIKLNNAVFLQQYVYLTALDLFERVYQQNGKDLRSTLARITEAAKKGADPLTEVRTLAEGPMREFVSSVSAPLVAVSGGYDEATLVLVMKDRGKGWYEKLKTSWSSVKKPHANQEDRID